MNAQDRAFFSLAAEWGLLDADALQQAEAWQREHGVPFDQAVVQGGLLSRDNHQRLLEWLQRIRFGCAKCSVAFSWEELASQPELKCPTCDAVLEPKEIAARAAPQRPSGAGLVSSLSSGAFDAVKKSERMMGAYVLKEELGRGSMGVVFLAHKPGLERRFAVKIIDTSTQDELGIARFKQEAQLASRLDDPGVVGVFDVGRDGPNYYYAMEYVPGPTLRSLVENQGRMDPREAAELVQKVARTVHHAHQRKVIHRDLKPANIIIAESNGRPRITDFGLARDPTRIRKLTKTGDVLGTPYYMAPEQMQGGDIDHRVDVYALGVILYECLTAQRPFTAKNAPELSHKVLTQQPPEIHSFAPEVPEYLVMITKVAMARRAGDRYMSAEALAEDLAAFLRGDVPSHASGIVNVDEQRDPLGLVVAFTLLICLLVGGVVGYQLTRDGEPDEPVETADAPTPPPAEKTVSPRANADLMRARRLARDHAPVEETLAAWRKAEQSGDPNSVRLEKAEFLLRRGRWDDARRAVRDLVNRQDLVGYEALRIRAEAFDSEDRRDQARAIYQELADSDPGVRGLVALAAISRNKEDTSARPLSISRKAVAADPDYVPAVIELVYQLIRRNLLTEARDHIVRGLELAPDCPRLIFMDGYRLAALREVAPAIDRVNVAIDLTAPTAPRGFLRLRGTLLLASKRLDEALRDLDRLLKTKPDVASLVYRGLVYWRKSEAEPGKSWRQKAVADWQRAYALDAADFESLLDKGFSEEVRSTVLSAVGSKRAPKRSGFGPLKPELRRRLEQRAAAARPPARAHLLEGLLKLGAGEEWSEAAPHYDKAREVAPQSPAVALELARALAGRQAYQEAFKAIARARDLGAPRAELDRLEAEVWWDLGKGHEAAPRFERLASRGNSIDAKCAMAQLLVAHDRLERALQEIEAALRFDPDHVPSLAVKARLLLVTGPERAKEAFELTTRALNLEGAISCRVLMARVDCMKIMATVDGQGRPRKIGPRDIRPVFEAYERAFPVCEGPSPELGAAGFALMIPGKHPWRDRIGPWLEKARELQPDRGMTYLLLGQWALREKRDREQVLEHWRKARAVEPRLIYPPTLLELYRRRYGGECPELKEFEPPPPEGPQ